MFELRNVVSEVVIARGISSSRKIMREEIYSDSFTFPLLAHDIRALIPEGKYNSNEGFIFD